MSDEKPKRMSEERFEDLVLKGLHSSTWASDYRALEAEAVRARESEKRLAEALEDAVKHCECGIHHVRGCWTEGVRALLSEVGHE